jgi:hypothetical protein
MKKRRDVLLVIDGLINLAIGVFLLLAPDRTMNILGLPPTNTRFYASILGAVLFGIGIALFVERFGRGADLRGLALGGAIAINLCGAGVLLLWLIIGKLDIPPRGHIVLWSVGIIVFLTGLAEIFIKSGRDRKNQGGDHGQTKIKP